jgi:hypothetical protein
MHGELNYINPAHTKIKDEEHLYRLMQDDVNKQTSVDMERRIREAGL